MNAVLLAVILMLVLAVCRVHVVIALSVSYTHLTLPTILRV